MCQLVSKSDESQELLVAIESKMNLALTEWMDRVEIEMF